MNAAGRADLCADPRHPDISVEEFVRLILERMQADDRRVVSYVRPRELSPPFSPTWIKARLTDGTLEAVKLRGITLISLESVQRMLESAEVWEPAR